MGFVPLLDLISYLKSLDSIIKAVDILFANLKELTLQNITTAWLEEGANKYN